MTRRAEFRVYPSAPQRAMLAKTFGCARLVWNDALGVFLDAYRSGVPASRFGDVVKQVTTLAKRTPERAFLCEVSNAALQQSLNDLRTARNNFFASLSGKRKGRRVGAPRFKSKHGRQSARFARNGFKLRRNGRLYLAKIGDLRVRWSLKDPAGRSIRLPAEPSSVTIIRKASGKFFVSFCYTTEDDDTLPPTPRDTGIDLGLKDFAVLRDGNAVPNPRFYGKGEVKLARLQRKFARAKKGSRRREAQRVKVARWHERIANQRDDFLEQLSTRVVRDNQAVVVEDLAVLGLSRGRAAKSVQDASWGSFLRLLESKCDRYGRDYVSIDRWFPSTQLCSSCGAVTGPKGQRGLRIRSWSCPCGVTHERDRNAEINIRREGRRILAERQETMSKKLAEGRSSADRGVKPESADKRSLRDGTGG
ncbi:RNA-guided endonuclease InsQ/TnpB family protein [Glycomyces lechevalierae]|uniref:Transposase n=3 Tax=Glycomycetaceae TaxID=85034 RepID=A0A9X3PHJ2_9ACTN|nr:transposase [Glycomyces lechevalierae]MDA1385017.1 transposase [Glycomyces lechevalierae]